MRILFVLENYYPNVGGVETLFQSHIEKLAAEGHQIQLITTKLFKDSPKVEHHTNLSIYRYNFINRYFFTFFAFIPVFFKVKNVDLVHTTSYNAALPALIGAMLRGKKTIITFHEVWGKLWFKLPYINSIAKNLYYSFEQFLLKLPFHTFVGVSRSTVQNLKAAGIAPEKVKLIYNGIDYKDIFKHKINTSDKNENKKFRFFFFGRLGISKGIDLILEAAKILKTELPDSELNFITPKTPIALHQMIESFIKDNDLEGYIKMIGEQKREDLFTELQKADCVLIPSYSEGFCFAAVECNALGIPVISSDKAALKEVVSGKFIRLKKLDVPSLVKACKDAYHNKFETTPLQYFHLDEALNNYLTLYNEIIESK